MLRNILDLDRSVVVWGSGASVTVDGSSSKEVGNSKLQKPNVLSCHFSCRFVLLFSYTMLGTVQT